MDNEDSPEDWTDAQIDLIVADYFDMLDMEIRGQPFVKAERNRALQQLIGRGRGSIEFKHQNISAVMVVLGLPWLRGYKPRSHFQESLVAGVERYLASKPQLIAAQEPPSTRELDEAPSLFLEPPPLATNQQEKMPAYVQRLARKFDPAIRDARNRALGRQGENLVVLSEVSRLRAEGRDDLSRKVRWVAELDGDGAGYDVLSFDSGGSERLLEVKTTTGGNTTPFYLSENERSLSDERPDAFRLIRLFDFARDARGFELVPPLSQHLHLTTVTWKAAIA